MNKSYGGYLPLELRKGTDYFSSFPAMRFNCANAAVDHVLSVTGTKKIYVPYYMCPNICANLDAKDISVIYYHIGEDLLPEAQDFDEGSCVYVTDYFGIMGGKTDKLIASLADHYVIADFCHSFFHKPVLKDNVYCIYSARKFFGVPDGAYLVNSRIVSDFEEESDNCSSDYSAYLIKSLEHGTDYSYAEKKQADEIIKTNKGKMSILSRRILCSVDYEDVRSIRQNNARLYDEAFGKINSIHMEEGCSPYMYPLNVGKDIRSCLVEDKIFTPTLWGQLLSDEFTGTKEFALTSETVFLPVDQRYGKEDIDNVIGIVRNHI